MSTSIPVVLRRPGASLRTHPPTRRHRQVGPRFLLPKDGRLQLYRVVRAGRLDCRNQVSCEIVDECGLPGEAARLILLGGRSTG